MNNLEILTFSKFELGKGFLYFIHEIIVENFEYSEYTAILAIVHR